MTIFSTENLKKAYGDKLLFENVSVGMQEGDRIGILGRNGVGKTTFMRIVAAVEQADSGNSVFNNKVNFKYLEQLPTYTTSDTVLDTVLKGNQNLYDLLNEFHTLCRRIEENSTQELIDKLNKVNTQIDVFDGWNFENEAKVTLSKLGFTDFEQPVNTLSGGWQKRVAIAESIISKPNLLILDEPTNHLDADSVQWLQDYLMNSNISLLFVTHDRYFLDAVSNSIWELYDKKFFTYSGDYENYLAQKAIYLDIEKSTTDHQKNIIRQEMEWLNRGAPARRKKQKSRIDWIENLNNEKKFVDEKKLKIEIGKSFMGSRIIDAYNLTKTINVRNSRGEENKLLFKDFTYVAQPGDRIGIIGPNGIGKSTLLGVLSGENTFDSGNIKIGDTAKIAYYHQHIKNLDESKTVIASVRDVAEYINVGVGKELKLTAVEMLDRFLFPRSQHASFISTLSGGERRRLSLLKLLMGNPNVLLLDEPTNDLDIQTLNSLEDWLDSFQGVLIVVSHDRSFLDRTVQFIKVFEGNGVIKEYPGNYTQYLETKDKNNKEKTRQKQLNSELENKLNEQKKQQLNQNNTATQTKSNKISFKEKKEFETLEIELEKLESEKIEIQNKLAKGDITDYKLLNELSEKLSEIENKIDEITMRWLELSEKQG
jgi:ATP-binding cassette subfamily F protein uup